jgi:hypothetical protein
VLEVASTTKGFLAPRMTSAQRSAIGVPAEGLLVYQVDAPSGFYVRGAAAWSGPLGASGGGGTGTVTAVTASAPLSSSGGTAPNITLGTVPVGSGGTGLASVGASGQVLTSDGTAALWTTPTAYAFPWTIVTGPTLQAAGNNGYVVTGDAQATITLPASSALVVGQEVLVAAAGAGGWKVVANPGQSITGTTYAPEVVLPAGTTWTAVGPSSTWASLAASGSGQKVVAGKVGDLWASTDFGITWARVAPSPFTFYSADVIKVAISDDGNTILAAEVAAAGAFLYVSTNGTAGPWTRSNTTGNWPAVCMSSTGSRLYASNANTRQVHLSTNGGVTWTAAGTFDAATAASSLACSSDGMKLVAASSSLLKTSTDGGATWTTRDAPRPWTAVASSSDGTRLFAVVNGEYVYGSINSGVTWTPRSAVVAAWSSVAASGDGTRILVSGGGSTLMLSSDLGTSWTPVETSRSWTAVAASSDLGRLFAAGNPTGIYRSSGVAVPVALRSTTTSVVGAQHASLELLYIGANQFLILSSNGAPSAP